jgi:hypothetical protein
MLLQWAGPSAQRNMSMVFDAALDITYFVVFSVTIHHVVGAASAPEDILSYTASFYPAFHAFTVACGLELAAMQRTVAAVEDRAAIFRKAKSVPRVYVWCLALTKALIVVFTVVHLCGAVYPMGAEGRCNPCVCAGDLGALKMSSCDAVAAVLPTVLSMSDKGIATIEAGVFSDSKFNALTVLDLQNNPIAAVHSLPDFVQCLDLSLCDLDDKALATVALALDNTKGGIQEVRLSNNGIGHEGPLILYPRGGALDSHVLGSSKAFLLC